MLFLFVKLVLIFFVYRLHEFIFDILAEFLPIFLLGKVLLLLLFLLSELFLYILMAFTTP